MATLQSIIDRAISVAVSKGLSSSKRVTVVNEIAGAEVMLIISFDEPYTIEAPLNLVWIDSDPESVTYKTARKRASRVAASGFTHTWLTVNDYSELSVQFWDTPEPADNEHRLHGDNIDNPHRTTPDQIGAVAKDGDTMLGPLMLKPTTALADFANDEAVSRSWVTLFTTPIQVLANQVKQGQAGMLTQINGVRNRVTALENRLRSKGFVFTLVEPSDVWNITHNLNSVNMNISLYDSDGHVLLTDIQHIDSNNVKVTFAVPTAGRANLQAIVI